MSDHQYTGAADARLVRAVLPRAVSPRVARDEDRRQQELTEAAIAWHAHSLPPSGLFDDSLDAQVARNVIRRKAEDRLHRAVEALLGD